MSDRPEVTITRCGSYSPDEVAAALASSLEPLGGMRSFVSPGQSVLIKVNLLMRSSPESAVTTHPELVRAVVREVISCGATEVAVGDSPGGRMTRSGMAALLETSGIGPVCREEGVRAVSLHDEVERIAAPGGKLYSSFNVGRDVARADVLISLPKMKTHGFMMFTGAVKNLFGCIPGLEKAQFHLKVPDREDFADMLLDLMLACRPALNVMDGIVAMEGEGPSSGTPRRMGVVIASSDAVALDVVASAVAGFDPMDVYTNHAAAKRGMGPDDPDAVEIAGVPWRDVTVADFAHPARDVSRRMPPALARWVRTYAASRPMLERRADCTGCATCAEVCPVGAIAIEEGTPVFDLGVCVHCYCCQELCPRHAIGLKSPWLAHALIKDAPRRHT